MNIKFFAYLFFAVASLQVPASLMSPVAAQTEVPAEVLQAVIDDIKTLWVPLNLEPEAPYDSRRAWTQNLIDTRFDFDHMSRSSLGTKWRTLGVDQQAAYVDLFYQILVETVIDWLDGYEGEVFDITRTRPAGRNIEIQTRFVQSGGRSATVTWVTRETEGIFRFRDVRVAGISLTADFRGRHQGILQRDGVEGLMAKLETDLAAYRQQHL